MRFKIALDQGWYPKFQDQSPHADWCLLLLWVVLLAQLLPSVKVDAFSKIVRPSLGKLIREVDAMLRPGGVLYVGFQSIATFCS